MSTARLALIWTIILRDHPCSHGARSPRFPCFLSPLESASVFSFLEYKRSCKRHGRFFIDSTDRYPRSNAIFVIITTRSFESRGCPLSIVIVINTILGNHTIIRKNRFDRARRTEWWKDSLLKIFQKLKRFFETFEHSGGIRAIR